MRRREFLTLLGTSAAAWPLAARAQQRKLPVVGWLAIRARGAPAAEAFAQGLSDAGFVEGHTVTFEYRSADEDYSRLPALAADLAKRPIDVLAAPGNLPLAVAAKQATSTIPIVFMVPTDPVEMGLVNSLNRPGGNLTGVAYLNAEIASKRFELLHKLAPDAKSFALFVNPDNPVESEIQERDLQAAAKVLGVRLKAFETRTPADIATAFAAAAQERMDALYVGVDGLFGTNNPLMVGLAAHYRIPTAFPWREFTANGGLMNYGALIREQFREAGAYTARILKGEKPAEMPVQRPTRLGFVLNLKTAKALGLDIPPALLALADEVIE